ncbi:MAG: YndM family protein [Peptococcaceae bacterium]|nr:YndM family protein [Peptococcaceae bacterium]
MGHFKVLPVKILLNGLPLLLILALPGGVSWVPAAVLALTVTMVSYIVGDLVILPETGNFTATVTDGGLALFILWVSRYLGVDAGFFNIILGTVALVVAEGLVYHPFLEKSRRPRKKPA